MKLLRLLGLLLSFFVTLNAFGAKDKIKVCVAEDYRPYMWREANGTFAGLETEITKAILDKAGVPYEFAAQPMQRTSEEMKRNDKNIMAVGVSKTEERLKFSIIDGAIYTPPAPFILANKAKTASKFKPGMKLNDYLRSGAQLGIVEGYSYTSWVDEQLKGKNEKDKVTRQPAKGLDDVAKLVAKGRFDYTISYPDVAKYWIDHNPDLAKDVAFFKIADIKVDDANDWLMFNKGFEPEWVKKILDTTAAFTKSPEYKTLLKKWIVEL